MNINKKVISHIKKLIETNEIVYIYYYNQQEWCITKSLKQIDIEQSKFDCYDYFSNDYIPYIATILIECAKQNIDVSKIQIESA